MANVAPTFFGFFAAGAVLYLYRDRIPLDDRWAWGAGLLLLPLTLSRYTAEPASATLGAYVLFTIGTSRLPVVGGWGERNDLSYGLYLYAWPVQQSIQLAFPQISVGTLIVASLAVGLGLAFLSWRLVERPFMRAKRRLRPEPETLPAPT